jgi:hypothetical protein
MSIVVHDPDTRSHQYSHETYQMTKTLDSSTIFRFQKEDNLSDLNTF